jgi:ankyrin repeat protein
LGGGNTLAQKLDYRRWKMGKAKGKTCGVIIWLILFSFISVAFVGCSKKNPQAYVTEIWEAVSKGDTSKVKLLLGKNPELLHVTNEQGTTLLHLAVYNPYIMDDSTYEVVKLLISKGADINAKEIETQCTPLHGAATLGLKEIVKLLLVNDANIHAEDQFGRTPLHNAALNARHNGTIQLLLDKGADINVTNTWGETPLELAWPLARISDWDDYDPNDKYAIWRMEIIQPDNYRDKIKTIEIFLNNGIDANTWFRRNVNVSGDPNSPRRVSIQPLLLLATCNNQKELVEILLAHGADVHAKLDNGITALHLAASRGNIGIAERLIKEGLDVNSRTAEGATPLYIAEHFEDRKMIDLLLKNGAKK